MKFWHVGQEIYHKGTKAPSFFVLTWCLGGDKPVSFLFWLVWVRLYAWVKHLRGFCCLIIIGAMKTHLFQ